MSKSMKRFCTFGFISGLLFSFVVCSFAFSNPANAEETCPVFTELNDFPAEKAFDYPYYEDDGYSDFLLWWDDLEQYKRDFTYRQKERMLRYKKYLSKKEIEKINDLETENFMSYSLLENYENERAIKKIFDKAQDKKEQEEQQIREQEIAAQQPVQVMKPKEINNIESNPEETVEWQIGIASAYGGPTDPSSGDTTATGDSLGMGVAIPMSWENYESYLGRTVEITYNGQTITATINDCGEMNGGSRSLDLQPAVWQSFGAKSCNDWGLREVSYRIL